MYIPDYKHVKDDFYAVERTGWIPVNRKGEILTPKGVTKGTPGRYFLYGNYPVHRIVAYTFLSADSDPDTLFVNHKDGNKHNNNVDNLEWCTLQHNALHAYQTGLRYDNLVLLVKDLETEEVTEFYSLQAAARYLGVNGGSLHQFLKRPVTRPFKIKYDITVKGEPFHDLTIDDVIPGIPTSQNSKIIIMVPDNPEEKSIIVSHASEVASLLNIDCSMVRFILGKNMSKKNGQPGNQYKGWKLYYLREFSTGRKHTEELIKNSKVIIRDVKFNKHPTPRKPARFKVTDIKTGDYEIWNSIGEYAESIGIKKDTLEERISKSKRLVIDGKIYEYIDKRNKTREWNAKRKPERSNLY